MDAFLRCVVILSQMYRGAINCFHSLPHPSSSVTTLALSGIFNDCIRSCCIDRARCTAVVVVPTRTGRCLYRGGGDTVNAVQPRTVLVKTPSNSQLLLVPRPNWVHTSQPVP